jgi:hypothetical protein
VSAQLDLLAIAENPHPLADHDRRTITAAVLADAQAHDGVVDPNRVRVALSNEHGLTVHPQALSATYSALARRGVLRSLGWIGTNDDKASGNAGRPMRLWQRVGPR